MSTARNNLIAPSGNAESFIRTIQKSPDHPQYALGRKELLSFQGCHEVLVNAMIHRDDQSIGTEIHVDMLFDCLEITYPGGMLSGGRIQ